MQTISPAVAASQISTRYSATVAGAPEGLNWHLSAHQLIPSLIKLNVDQILCVVRSFLQFEQPRVQEFHLQPTRKITGCTALNYLTQSCPR
jgi:hypothetical protein